jgi:hypothetical protein
MRVVGDDEQESRASHHLQYGIWDLMVWTSLVCCFAALVRLLGAVSVILLPGLLIGRSVIAHPKNSRDVKFVFIVVMAFLTIYLCILIGRSP